MNADHTAFSLDSSLTFAWYCMTSSQWWRRVSVMKFVKNAPLIIGISIPFLMIAFVSAAIYLPGYFAEPPSFDFIYVTGDDYYPCAWEYRVINNKLDRTTRAIPPADKSPAVQECLPIFYRHNVQENKSTQLTYEQASLLALDERNISQDGYEVVRGSGGNGFPFFFDNGNYDTVYLRGNHWSTKMNITSSNQPYYYNFRFLGWILP